MGAQPKMISTFAGCGGSSLGYKWAGFHELLAIDFDDHAVATFEANFPDVPVWNRDITKMTAKEILDFTKLKKGELDVLDGSPPCQGFSISNVNRVVADKRNDLFLDFIRLIKGLQPKVFVMENVPGMMRGNMKGYFNLIINAFEATKYIVDVKLMNAKYYGVPQSRERLIFIGVRPDLKTKPSFPKPSRKTISVGDAVKDVTAKTYMKLRKGSFSYSLWTKIPKGRNAQKYHPKGNLFNFVKLNPNRPSNTITKFAYLSENGAAGLYHWSEPRTMSIEELKRISTFPDDFKFEGKFFDQWGLIGNAVMPKMMEAIALNIKNNILNHEPTNTSKK